MTIKKKSLYSALAMMLGGMMLAGQAQAFEFGAFGDVRYTQETNQMDTFAIGGLDLYARQDISDNTQVFIEYVFENDGEGFVLDLERMYIKRTINDMVSIGAGRFHSPLGYWNNNYHHGVMIQDTVSRPSFLDFEDGEAAILPTHVIGIDISGQLPMGFGYQFAMANSTFLDTNQFAEIGIGNVFDASDDKTLFYRFTYDVKDIGLKLGLFGLEGSVVEFDSDGNASLWGLADGDTIVDQSIMGLDVRYSIAGLDILAEYFMIENAEASTVGDGKTHDADAYYVQFSYQVTDQFRPTYRYESLAFDAGQDEYFVTLGTTEYTANLIALRYDLDDSNALTLEYKEAKPEVGSTIKTVTLDWSFLMF